MGVMKQMWSDNFTENTRVSVRLKQKLPEGPRMSYVSQPEQKKWDQKDWVLWDEEDQPVWGTMLPYSPTLDGPMDLPPPPAAQLMQRLSPGKLLPSVVEPAPLSGIYIIEGMRNGPFAGTGCRHEWNQVVGIYKVYENCKHCGIAKEVLGAANS